jgi:hypothetical protein
MFVYVTRGVIIIWNERERPPGQYILAKSALEQKRQIARQGKMEQSIIG